MKNHVIICGFGRIGQNFAYFLDKRDLPSIGIDLDPRSVHNALLAGQGVYHGDAIHPEILQGAKLYQAKAVVITLHGRHLVKKILQEICQSLPSLPLIVNACDDQDSRHYYGLGATEVISEDYESSLMFALHDLFFMGVHSKLITY